MKYYRVTLPVLQIIPCRHAQPGQVLERTVFTPDGRLLAEGNTKIDRTLLTKFKNFKVRTLVIHSQQEHWLPEAEVEKLGSRATVIEDEEFSEAAEDIITTIRETNSVQKMRKVARYLSGRAMENGNENAAQKLEETILRSYQLEDKIETLTEQLKSVEDPDARDEIMSALEGTISELEESFLEITAPENILKGSVAVVNEREEIRTSITDFVNHNPELIDANEEAEESLAEDLISEEYQGMVSNLNKGRILAVISELEEKCENPDISMELDFIGKELKKEGQTSETLKKQLSEETSDLGIRKTLIDIIEGQKTVTRKKLEALPVSQDFARKSWKFVEERGDIRSRLWEAANAAADSEFERCFNKKDFIGTSTKTPKKPCFISADTNNKSETILKKAEIEEIVDYFDQNEISSGITKLIEKTKESSDFGAQMLGQLNLTEKNIEQLQEKGKELAENIQDEVESPEIQNNLLKILGGEEKSNEQDLRNIDISNELSEKLIRFDKNRENQRRRLWEAIDELSGGTVREIKGARDKLASGTRGAAGSKQFRKKSVTTDSSANDRTEKNKLSLDKALKERDPYDLSNISGVDFQTVKEALHVLAPPAGLKKQQQLLLKDIQRLCDFVFYGNELDEDRLANLVAQAQEVITNSKQPIKLLADPPAGDRYLLTHTMNTFIISILIGTEFELKENELFDLAAASICLDLGMIEIPLALWGLQDGKLSGRGAGEIHKHPLISEEIVARATNNDSAISDLVIQHHERRDGSGYPHGIDSVEQHPLTPVLTVADSYTAMIEKRTHRNGLAPDRALLTMLKNGAHYERETVKALLGKLGFYPNGCVVMLSDGRLSVVQAQTAGNPLSPKVFAITDKNRNKLSKPQSVNLSKSSTKIKNIIKR